MGRCHPGPPFSTASVFGPFELNDGVAQQVKNHCKHLQKQISFVLLILYGIFNLIWHKCWSLFRFRFPSHENIVTETWTDFALSEYAAHLLLFSGMFWKPLRAKFLYKYSISPHLYKLSLQAQHSSVKCACQPAAPLNSGCYDKITVACLRQHILGNTLK